MDELNRPLGRKPEDKQSMPKTGRGNAAALLAMVIAVCALGLVLWQTFGKPNPAATVVSQEQDGSADNGTKDLQAAEAEQENSRSQPGEEGDIANGEDSDEGTGLVELVPDGNIAVPKPRPPKAEPQEAALAHLPDPELAEQGATGVIPRRSPDGRRPMDVYAREPDTTGNFGVARVVLIVGGIGISQTTSQQAIAMLPPAVTLAFAPSGNSLARWMQTARKKGHELLLQVPMEAFGSGGVAGARILSSTASAEENIANLHWSMSRITNYVGLMNYQGARLMNEPAALKPVFDEIAERGLLFVDDGSAGANKSEEVARDSILPFAKAFTLIDARRTRNDIVQQLDALAREAKRTGVAIGVSNGFSESIELIAEFAARAGANGIEITPVSAVASDPERSR